MVPRAPEVRCEACAYSLAGLGTAGKCPECGTAFDLQPKRRRERPVIPKSDRVRYLWDRFGPTCRTLAIVFVIVGLGGVAAWLGWTALDRLVDEVGGWRNTGW